MKKSLTTAVLISGLIVGTLDITFACIQVYILNGTMPYRVLKYISSAIMGKEAYNGGSEMVILGLLMHYFIAFSFTILFQTLCNSSIFFFPVPVLRPFLKSYLFLLILLMSYP